VDFKESLHQLIEERLASYLLVVVSNREPYIHTFSGDEIECLRPASGLTVALDPVMRAAAGVWIAHGSGDADRAVVDSSSRVMVPPENPQYALRRVWLSKEEEDGYYYGFANDAMWPLCHIAFTPPTFNEADWNTYKKVNSLFAEVILQEVGTNQAIILVQDYHFALLPRMIKAQNPQLIVGQFWHIPWPNYEIFRICPWQEEILDGLLGNDILGFHIQYHCNNFLETADRAIECRIDREKFAVILGGETTLVRPFPISVDFEALSAEASTGKVEREMKALRHRWGLGNKLVGIGIDRIDYTKGIPERLRALDRFFEKYPEYIGRMVFIQLGTSSRVRVEKYREINERIDHLVEEINRKYESASWEPIIYVKELASPVTLAALRRIADFCMVSSLHDGMNLVAKEFVSSRIDEDGVLILSQFCGAAWELSDALVINPYATDEFAETIKKAVEMPQEEKMVRMRRMREQVRENDIYHWGIALFSELAKLRP